MTFLLAFVLFWAGGQLAMLRSPVEDLVREGVYGPVNETVAVVGLGAMLIAAAISLLLPALRRVAWILLTVLIVATVSVFFVAPRRCFNPWDAPWVLSETGHFLATVIGLAAGGIALLQSRE